MNIQIPTELYGRELKQYLYKQSISDNTTLNKVYKIIRMICLSTSDEIFEDFKENEILKKETLEIIENNKLHKSLNVTISSKSLDILSTYKKGLESINLKKEASQLYLTLYKKTKRIEELNRSITIRNVRSLNSDEFIIQILSELPTIKNAFNQKTIIESLLKSYEPQKFESIIEFVLKATYDSHQEKNFISERDYLTIQKLIKVMSPEVFAYHVSLSYEAEADCIQLNEDCNTLSPQKKANYQHAYNKLYPIRKKFKTDFKRITCKLEKSIQDFNSKIQSFPPIKYMQVPDEFIKKINQKSLNYNIISFENLFDELLKINIYSDIIKTYINKLDKGNSSIVKYLNHIVLDSGYVEANPEYTEFNIVLSHKSIRLLVLNEILSLFNYYIFSDIFTSRVEIYQYFTKVKPLYIEENVYSLWALGIFQALENDMFSASYILLPLLERALRNLIQRETGSSRKLDKNIQTSYNLTDTLNRLDSFIDNTSLNELKFFLNNRSDVNFRNNLLHGHLVSNSIRNHGAYLLWICLKFIHLEGNPPFKLLE